MVERGIIKAVSDDGYIVASLDRNGIVTPPIKAADEQVFDVGDMVYFLFFTDGTGKILFPV